MKVDTSVVGGNLFWIIALTTKKGEDELGWSKKQIALFKEQLLKGTYVQALDLVDQTFPSAFEWEKDPRKYR